MSVNAVRFDRLTRGKRGDVQMLSTFFIWNDRLVLSSYAVDLRGGSNFGFPQAGTQASVSGGPFRMPRP